MGNDDAPRGEQLFNVAEAEAEAEVKPDGVADDFRGEAVSGVEAFVHAAILQDPAPAVKLSIPAVVVDGHDHAAFSLFDDMRGELMQAVHVSSGLPVEHCAPQFLEPTFH